MCIVHRVIECIGCLYLSWCSWYRYWHLPVYMLYRCDVPVARDLNWPSSERGVGHLEALGTRERIGGGRLAPLIALGGTGTKKKSYLQLTRQICGGLSHMGMCIYA
jgi:hypothetical protein